MLTVYPDYYPAFSCIAERCRHTCCAGWEIDIDEETLEKYRCAPGAVGDKLRRAIDEAPTPHFVLAAGGRCPFLTAENLCELILSGGEGMLCRICRDHPRWRSFLPGRTEVGVGLCCEAAARLILTSQKPVELLYDGTDAEEDAETKSLVTWRDAAVDLAQKRGIPLPARMEALLVMCRAELPDCSMREWASFYRRLERLDGSWTNALDTLEADGDLVDITHISEEYSIVFEQLLVYFLHRHFLQAYGDGDAAGKAAFAVLSTRVIMTLCALKPDLTLDDIIEYARIYSAEIEYSDENLDALFDELWNG